MKNLSNRKISEIINTVKDALKRSENRQLSERLKAFKKLKREFSKKYSSYRKVVRDYNDRIEKIRTQLKEISQELEILSLNKNVFSQTIPIRVPDELDNLKVFLDKLISVIQSLKITNARLYIDQLRSFYADIGVLEKEKPTIEKVEKEFKDIYTKVEQEVNAINQILYPEENVLVNVRERFD